jgi:hypothetical protein
MSQHHAAASPAQHGPETIGSVVLGAQGLREGIQEPLTESQVLATAPLRAAGGMIPRWGGGRRTPGEGQKGLKVVEQAGGRFGSAQPTGAPVAGRHPTKALLKRKRPTPG